MPPYDIPSIEEIARIHREILASAGSGELEGILLPGNLSLAAEAPNRTVYGIEPYPSLEQKAAVLMHEISKLHPFVSGNKRTAFASADTLLRMNGKKLTAPLAEKISVSVQTAQCRLNVDDLTGWIEGHVAPS